MAISAFIPSVWSARVLDRLRASLVHEGLFNRDYEGDVAAAGNTVKVPTFEPVVTVGDEQTAGGAYQDLTVQDIDVGTTADLQINQRKVFNVRVHDVDRAQSQVDVMTGIMDDAAFQIGNTVDTYCQTLLNGTIPAARVVTDTAAVADTGKVAGGKYVESVINLAETMDNANIPAEGRWLTVPPVFVRRLQRYMLDKGGSVSVYTPASDEEALRNGFAGRLSGFDLRVTTKAQKNGTAGADAEVFRCFASAGTRAGSFVSQITQMEAMRDTDRFADKVRGLYVYGGLITLPAWLFRMDFRVKSA